MDLKEQVINEIVEIIKDYRKGEIEQINYFSVLKWINQFDTEYQVVILIEFKKILSKRYISRNDFWMFYKGFIEYLMKQKDLDINKLYLLDIQRFGSSQHDVNEIFKDVLKHEFRVKPLDKIQSDNTFIYLDEGIFTGNRVLVDLKEFIFNTNLKDATILIFVISEHIQGTNYFLEEFKKLTLNRNIKVAIFSVFKNDIGFDKSSGVLKLSKRPSDFESSAYIDNVIIFNKKKGREIELFRSERNQNDELFSNWINKEILEEQFFKYGVRILSGFKQLEKVRPFGFDHKNSFGFGGLLITYRNIPNNCPLVLWASNENIYSMRKEKIDWIPLFPRKISKRNITRSYVR